jgi:hypothetical protein
MSKRTVAGSSSASKRTKPLVFDRTFFSVSMYLLMATTELPVRSFKAPMASLMSCSVAMVLSSSFGLKEEGGICLSMMLVRWRAFLALAKESDNSALKKTKPPPKSVARWRAPRALAPPYSGARLKHSPAFQRIGVEMFPKVPNTNKNVYVPASPFRNRSPILAWWRQLSRIERRPIETPTTKLTSKRLPYKSRSTNLVPSSRWRKSTPPRRPEMGRSW